MSADGPLVHEARRLADELLFPTALATDAAGLVPQTHLDALAAAGFYALASPPIARGLGLDAAAFAHLVEILAGGCLTTTFVWLQHHSVVRAVFAGPDQLRDRWLADLCAGRTRGGIAIAGVRPGHVTMRARPDPGGRGWIFDGTTSWVTGWGRIDVVLTAARTDDDRIVWAVLDAVEGPHVRVDPLPLVAVAASGTVLLHLADLPVDDGRVTAVETVDEWSARDVTGLRTNGSLALGVAGRCAALLESPALRDEVGTARTALDTATLDGMAGARAAASELAWRAAGALVAAGGSRSVLLTGHPQRLAREAAFLLVFGQRPPIRADLLGLLGAADATG